MIAAIVRVSHPSLTVDGGIWELAIWLWIVFRSCLKQWNCSTSSLYCAEDPVLSLRAAQILQTSRPTARKSPTLNPNDMAVVVLGGNRCGDTGY